MRDAFIVAEAPVDVGLVTPSGTEARRMVLQRFSGAGTLVVAGAGDIVDLNPARYGGALQVDTAAIVAFDDRLAVSVDRVAVAPPQGISTVFGASGVLVATLEGDGDVLLQTATSGGERTLFSRRAGDERQRAGLLGTGSD